MFDGPSDLIVLPCNTEGGVTRFVLDHLKNFHIPPPDSQINYGEIKIRPFTGAENIAQYVAYAASVHYAGSTVATPIKTIGEQLGQATRIHEMIRAISAPLLGAGAGGLKSEKSVLNLSEGFLSKATSDSVLTISILHKDVYFRLKNNIGGIIADLSKDLDIKQPIKIDTALPRVFVSYTGTSPKHKDWVKSFATYLRKNGIDARIDIWHLRRGMDLTQWMCNELQIADKVIIIADEKYAQKANGRHGGVGWETMLIQGDMASQSPESTKYLAIVRTENYEDGLPTYLKTKYCFHWPENISEFQMQNELDELIKELFEVSEIPPIGEPPIFIG